jgi:hypothetical protein
VKPRPPWWTAADEAELAAVVFALIRDHADHRKRCPACQVGGPCLSVRQAIRAAVEWAHGRHLLSRAQWLREQEADVEAELRVLGEEGAA